ncbi:SRPBCC family protein [Paenibacillus sp. HWE-109]|uniref:SRPBCC family protein n=1 Tax=Paenibacillus sp. HWE-109 TaxID=1306526 RepID=UPI001EDD6A9A|nr:SRPBCC family protein [Paenibacillus sp. HWE-109]UKS28635.1 SRPBCC family protein [Paenibacillus sp. HWE-109]
MNKTSFAYTTYIATTPEKLWAALTTSEFTKQYFFGREIVSDWQVGSSFKLMNKDKVEHYGEVLVYEPYRLLTISWSVKDVEVERMSTVTYELTPMDATVKLSLRHEELLDKDIRKDEGKIEGFNNGWPVILSNLKSLLETGQTLAAF